MSKQNELFNHKEPSPHHNRFFFYWAVWIIRHRGLAFSLSVMIALISISLIIPAAMLPAQLADIRQSILGHSGLMVDTSVDAFSDPNNDSVEVLERYRDLFGRDDYFMVLIEGDVFSMPYLEKLQKLHFELEGLNIQIASLGERRGDLQRKAKGQSSDQKDAESTTISSSDDFGFDEGFTEDGDGWDEGDQSTVIEEVTSLINARRTRGTVDGIVIDKWLDPLPKQSSLADLKSRILSDPTLVGQVVGQRGRHSMILLRANFMSEDDTILVNKKITDIAKSYHDPKLGFDVKISGMPELNGTLKASLLGTLRVLLILSIILMLGMLFYQFRHIIGIIPPLIVVAMAALNTFAMMCVLDMPVTMLSNILPAFIICVGIGDSVHLLSVYRDHFKEHRDPKIATIETVAMTGTPVLFTSLTTMIGLLSFRFASIPAIQEMGTAGAIGVGAACFHSLFFLPIILSFNKNSLLGLEESPLPSTPKPIRKPDWLDRFIEVISDSQAGLDEQHQIRPESNAERKRRKLTLWLGIVVTMIAIFGATKLRVWHSPLAWLPADQPSKIAFDITDQELGGSANLQLLIHGGDRGMKDIELIKGIEKLKDHINAYIHPEYGQIIGNSININDIVKETRRALKEGQNESYSLPDTDEELSQLLFLFENSGPDQLRKLATNDLSYSQMTVRLKWLEATAYRGLTQYVDHGIKKYIPSHATVSPTGTVYTLVSTVGALLMDLVRSFGAALIVITLIMILMLKGLKLGLLSMVPNLIPIIWLMGFMGFMGITIDMNNILIASIAIGLAVDDTIHLLHHFRIHFEEDRDSFKAINASLRHAGRAMVTTSSILTLGFFAYIFSNMKNIQTFGLLIGLSAALAMLIDLIFAPALLRTFYPRVSISQQKLTPAELE
jgi:uncharacterized protein